MSRISENSRRLLTLAALFGVSAAVYAAGADLGQAQKQATNWTAISMFAIFVALSKTSLRVWRRGIL